MRLDKYLKVSRIIKRRTLAKELLDLGRVEINGRIAKPSSEININDILVLKLRGRKLTIKATKILENAKIDEANEMFIVLNEEIYSE